MIPAFPTFKQLALSDKEDVERHTLRRSCYSDFEFSSLWAWNVHDAIQVSEHQGTLVVRFTDYVSNEPFLSIFGAPSCGEVVDDVLDAAPALGVEAVLRLVPEFTVEGLCRVKFHVEEERDHFDYLFEPEALRSFPGRALHKQRCAANRFIVHHPDHTVARLSLTDAATQAAVLGLWDRWEHNGGVDADNERQAYTRFASSSEHFVHVAVGVTVEGLLAGFAVATVPGNGAANWLFCKADTHFQGIYPYITKSLALALECHGCTVFNHEQDLGIEGLRTAKMRLRPSGFLRKYTVSRC